MRFFRTLFIYFANNHELVNKLADSKPIRQTARFVVYLLSKTGRIQNIPTLSNPKDFAEYLKILARTFKKEIQDATTTNKKNQPK